MRRRAQQPCVSEPYTSIDRRNVTLRSAGHTDVGDSLDPSVMRRSFWETRTMGNSEHAENSPEAFDVFLSHSSNDKPAVEAIGNLLQAQGIRPFLDKWNLPVGAKWQKELIAALDASTSVAVFIGPSASGPWQDEELQLARRSIRTEPGRLPSDSRVAPRSGHQLDRSVSRERTWVEFSAGVDDAEALQRLVAGVRGAAYSGDAFALPDTPAPYRGLFRFETADAKMFFGRGDDIQRLIDKLNSSAFVAVVGASGSGKSSLVRAGLMPRLDDVRASAGGEWHTLVCLPGVDPFRSLAEKLAQLDPGGVTPAAIDQLVERLRSRDDGLITAIRAYNADPTRPVLIVIDQFEELFTLDAGRSEADVRTDAARFVANLAAATADPESAVKIVVTMRADFTGSALSVDGLADLLQDNELLLAALTGTKLREAIVQPAKQVGAMFEKGLVSMIIDDVDDEPGALPLLQHALFELWTDRRGPWLTVDAYEESGGVVGALSKRAQQAYEGLTPAQKRAAPGLFIRLTTFGDGVPDTRRRASRDELYPTGIDRPDIDSVLAALSGQSARLIVVEEETVEVAHEALLRNWITLRGWLDENREGLKVHRRLTEAAKEWDQEQNRDSASLYTEPRLSTARDYAATHAAELTELESTFLTESAALAETELEAERRRSARLRRRLFIALAAVVLALVGGAVAVLAQRSAADSAERARDAESIAVARELASRSEQAFFRSPDLAALLAREADRTGSNEDTATALLGVVFSPWQRQLTTAPVESLQASPDGRRFLTVDESGVSVWDADGNRTAQPPTTGKVSTAAFSGDGTHVLTVDEAGATLWTADGDQVFRSPNQVSTARTNRTGTRVLTSSDAGVALWSVDGTRTSLTTIGSAIGLSPDGNRVVTVAGNELTVWRADGETFAQHDEVAATDVTFNHDGSAFATFGPDGALLWTGDADDPTPLETPVFSLPFLGDPIPVSSVTFDGDGRRVVTTDGDAVKLFDPDGLFVSALPAGSSAPTFDSRGRLLTAGDGGVVSWRSEDGLRLATLTPAFAVAAVPIGDEGRFVTAGDGGIALWNLKGNRLAVTPVEDTRVAAFVGEEQRVATIVNAGVVVWDPATNMREELPTGEVSFAAFSPDGRRIVTRNSDGFVLWAGDGSDPVPFGPSTNGFDFGSATFSGDGDLVITTGIDGLTLWDAENGSLYRSLDTGQLVASAALSNDGTQVVTTAFSGVAVWSLDEVGQGPLATLTTDSSVNQATFNDDDSRILTAGSDGVALWSTDGGRLLTLTTTEAISAEFSPDGTRILTADQRGVAVWNLAGNRLASIPFTGERGGVYSASFDRTGSRVVTNSDDGIEVWQVWDDDDATRTELDRRIGLRQFTPAECELYSIDRCPTS